MKETTHSEIIAELGFGIVPNIFAAADANPEAQAALWQAFRHTVLRGVLPRTLKEMMGVLVSRAAGSSYAAQVHLHALSLQGIDEPIVAALDRDEVPSGVPAKTAALLAFAHSAARNPHDPAQLEGLKKAGLSEAEILEAVAVVGLFRMVNSWTDLLDISLDEL